MKAFRVIVPLALAIIIVGIVARNHSQGPPVSPPPATVEPPASNSRIATDWFGY